MQYFRPGSQLRQLITMLSIVGEYPIRSLYLLGNERAYKAMVHKLTTPETFRIPQSETELTTRLLTVTGKGNGRSVRFYKGALPILDWLHPDAYRYYMDAFWEHKFPGNAAHRDRNHRVAEAVAMCMRSGMPVLYSCHPRSRKRLEESGFQLDRRVIAHKPLGFHDYNCLQMNAFCVVSDSGTLPEESSFYLSVGKPFPAVCIRTSTERPEALDKGCFVLSGIHTEQLLQSIDLAVQMQQNGDFGAPVPDYTAENVSVKVARIIQSYTGIVDRFVWRK